MHWRDLGPVATHWWWILLAVIALALIEILWQNERTRRHSLHWLKGFTTFLRWLLVTVAFTIILVATRPLRDLESQAYQKASQSSASSTTTASGTPNSGTTNPQGAQSPQEAKGQSEADIKGNFDELKWLLTILAGFAVITAIAQAAAAWLSALTYDKQAKEKLQEIDKVQESVQARYPLFRVVEEKRKEAHAILIELLGEASRADDPRAGPTEAISWLDDFYRDVKPEKRQLVLSVESFASIDLDPGRAGSPEENLKRFAVFYHSKFRYEKRMKVASFCDLERAEYYLLLALKELPADFTLHNEIGNLYLTMWEHIGQLPAKYPDYLRRARDSFDASLDLQKNQQRAYYNLAYIEAVYDKKPDAASGRLTEALAGDKPWQRNSSSNALAAYIHYNLGCNRARIIVRDHQGAIDTTLALPALSELEAASRLGQIRPDYVEDDYTKPNTGDIYDLYQRGDQAVRGELDRIKQLLIAERPAEEKPRKTVTRTIAEAFRMVWKSIRDET
jgi:hypothetical protein